MSLNARVSSASTLDTKPLTISWSVACIAHRLHYSAEFIFASSGTSKLLTVYSIP